MFGIACSLFFEDKLNLWKNSDFVLILNSCSVFTVKSIMTLTLFEVMNTTKSILLLQDVPESQNIQNSVEMFMKNRYYCEFR